MNGKNGPHKKHMKTFTEGILWSISCLYRTWRTIFLGNTPIETISCIESTLLWSAKPYPLWEHPYKKPMLRKRIKNLEAFCNLLLVPLFS
jgi:hypothetical protein